MRIHKNRIYVLRRHPGMSGFQQWDKLAYTVIGGERAQQETCGVWREFDPSDFPDARYFGQNGHLPEYQPELEAYEIVEALPLFPMGIRVVLRDP